MKNKRLLVYILIILLAIFAFIALLFYKLNKPKRPLQSMLSPGVVDKGTYTTPKLIKDKILGLSDIGQDSVTTQSDTVTNNNTNSSSNKVNNSDKDTSSVSKHNNDKPGSSKNNPQTSSKVVSNNKVQDLFTKKLNYISSTAKNNSKSENTFTEQEIQNIFLDDLVTIFGKEKMEAVFIEVEKIDFIEPKITNNEATAIAILQKTDGSLLNYKTYFYFKNGDWFLYKTQEQ